MKKSKKILSLIMAIVVMMTGIMNGMVIVSATGEATYEFLLNETFDGGDVSNFKSWSTSTEANPAVTITPNQDGTATISDPGNWSYGGFELSEPIGEGEYEISFDFVNFETTNTSHGVYLKGATSDLSDTSNDPRILHRDGVNLKAFKTLTFFQSYAADTWYNQNIKLTSTATGYDVTAVMTRHRDSYKIEKTISIDTSSLRDKDLNRIVFGYSNTITIDNLVVKKKVTVPVVPSVPSDGTLLNETFDGGNVSNFKSWSTGTDANPAVTISANQDGTATISDPGNWSYGGFELSEPIGEGEYEISFDFVNFETTNTSHGVYLKGATSDLSDTSNDPRILHRDGVNLKAFKTLTFFQSYAADTWYNQNIKLTSTATGYDVTAVMTRHRDSYKIEKTISIDTSSLRDKDLNRIVFGYSNTITIDNLVVKKKVEAAIPPEVESVEYYNAADEKQDILCQGTNKVKVKFSAAMKEETLADIDFTDGIESIVSGGTLSDDKMTYTLTLSDTPVPDATYTLTVPNTVQSADNANMADAYSVASKAVSGDVIFFADYDNVVPEFILLEGSKPLAVNVLTDENDNKYGKTNEKVWRIGGYNLPRTISANGEYEISYDFMLKDIADVNNNRLGVMYLAKPDATDRSAEAFTMLRARNTKTDGSETPESFDVGVPQNGTAQVKSIPNVQYGDAYKATWYTYKMTFNKPENTYTVTVSEKNNPSVTGTVTGTNLPDVDFGRILIGTENIIALDNITVKKVIKAPVLKNSSVEFVKDDVVLASGADNKPVSLTANKITLDFGTDISPASVTKTSVKLEKKATPENVAALYEVAANGTKAEITAFALEGNTTYVITVTKAVCSVSNEQLSKEFTIDFTTKAQNADASIKELTGVDELSKLDGELTIKLNAENTTGEAVEYALIIAYYTNDKRLSKVELVPVEIATNTDGEISKTFTVEQPDDAISAGVMLWESLNSVTPLCNVLKF